jgi:hypothetical protein
VNGSNELGRLRMRSDRTDPAGLPRQRRFVRDRRWRGQDDDRRTSWYENRTGKRRDSSGSSSARKRPNAKSANVDWSSWPKEQADQTDPVRNPIPAVRIRVSPQMGNPTALAVLANWSATAARHRPGLPVMADTSNSRALDTYRARQHASGDPRQAGLTFNPKAPARRLARSGGQPGAYAHGRGAEDGAAADDRTR